MSCYLSPAYLHDWLEAGLLLVHGTLLSNSVPESFLCFSKKKTPSSLHKIKRLIPALHSIGTENHCPARNSVRCCSVDRQQCVSAPVSKKEKGMQLRAQLFWPQARHLKPAHAPPCMHPYEAQNKLHISTQSLSAAWTITKVILLYTQQHPCVQILCSWVQWTDNPNTAFCRSGRTSHLDNQVKLVWVEKKWEIVNYCRKLIINRVHKDTR